MAQSEVDLVIAAASPAGANVETLPSLLTVFGGALSSKQEIEGAFPPKSCRDAYVQWLAVNSPNSHRDLLLPENYDDWSNFNVYSDLLLFEADLGYLTSAVVIFLEAAGSIAELGAFSQIDSLKDKLVIVVIADQHPKKSFISLGPLLQLENKDRDSICVIPAKDASGLLNDIDVVNSAIEKKISQSKSQRVLSCTSKQHQFALILDFIALIEVATFTDIKQFLDHFHTGINDHRLQQILFTLEKATLIARRRYGGIDYYSPKQRGSKYIEYRSNETGEKFNRGRLQAKIIAIRDPKGSKSKVLQLHFPKGDGK